MNKFTKPTIGITTFNQNEDGQYHLASTCVEAIRRCGGLPVLLPPGKPEDSAAILEVVDGLIFSGGGDIDPATYDGSNHPAISAVDRDRDAFELTLFKQALNTDIPMLGICRGTAVMAVASGGSLIAHIPDEFDLIAHQGNSSQSVKHLVQIKPDSYLAAIMETTVAEIVSLHHQAVRTVPQGWHIAASGMDGVIEALEHEYHPWAIALQWHPELAIDDPTQQRIFQALVEVARTRKISFLNECSRNMSLTTCT